MIKGVSETVKNEANKEKSTFLRTILGTWATSILGNLLTGKPKICRQGVIRACEWIIQPGEGVIQAGEGTVRAGLGFQGLLIF